MSEVGAETAVAMIRSATSRLTEAADELSRLDAVAGDGDHGVNIAAAFADADTRIADQRPDTSAEVFLRVARAFNEGSGGASGALFGAFFVTLGDRLRSSASADITDFVDGLELGSRRVGEIGRTKPGDKTMLDALQPAVDASRSTLNEGGGAVAVFAAAAAAAQRGADSTADMRAKAGRARYAPTGATGTRDPGAVTLAVMFHAWADAIALPPDRQSAAPTPGKATTPSGNGLTSYSERLRAATRSDRASMLDRLATDSGHLAILALDHVRSFAMTMRPHDPDSLTPDEMRESKQQLIDSLAHCASAILIDPVHASSRTRAVSSSVAAGLVIGIEDADYEAAPTRPRLLPGWTVERAVREGADAVKISVYFDPDDDTSAAEQFVEEAVFQCDRLAVPLFCEPLAQIGDRRDTRRKVLEGVRRFGSLGATVLKIQFPHDTHGNQSRDSWAEACQEADSLSSAPWALLSEGRDFSEFCELLTIACRAGASGFVAGRAIWGGVGTDQDALAISAQRLEDLRSIAISEGSAWNQRRSPSDSSTPMFEVLPSGEEST